MTTTELIELAKNIETHSAIIVRNMSNQFVCGVYYKDNTWVFMFDEFTEIQIDDMDALGHFLHMYGEDEFGYEIYDDIPNMCYEIRQTILNNTLIQIIDNPDSNTCEIIRDGQKLLGKPVKFLGNQTGVVVNLVESLSDFYYGVVKPDGTFFYESCVGRVEIIPDEEISGDLQDMINNRHLLMNIRRKHVLENKYSTDLELIHI